MAAPHRIRDNSLIDALEKITPVPFSGQAYADDAMWIATSRRGIQQSSDTAQRFCSFFGAELAVQKCVFAYLKWKREPTGHWTILEDELPLSVTNDAGEEVNMATVSAREHWGTG